LKEKEIHIDQNIVETAVLEETPIKVGSEKGVRVIRRLSTSKSS